MQASARTRWRCRRGYKELDLLLGRFLEQGYDDLDADGRESFEALLDEPCHELLLWLSGTEPVPKPELEAVVARIRARG